MNIVPIKDIAFDDKMTLAMGLAFDQACESLGGIGRTRTGREIVAKCIIGATKNAEWDPVRLCAKALRALRHGDAPAGMPIAGGDRDFPVPVSALIAHTA